MPLSPSRVAATSLKAVPRKRLSRILGRVTRVQAPERLLRTAVDVYCRAYGVELDDYRVPDAGFPSFDAFFTRELKPGVRRLDPDPAVVTSPADGRVEDAGAISVDATLRIKGKRYSAAELLGDASKAADFEGGSFAIIYLSPRDYHRVHAPVTGNVTSVRHVGGTLFPVNDIGLQHIPLLFARNERIVVHQHTERFGPVATIMVGAMFVGRISVSFDHSIVTNNGKREGNRDYGGSGPILERGQELGTFHMGSTAIVMLPRCDGLGVVRSAGDSIRMGEALMREGLA